MASLATAGLMVALADAALDLPRERSIVGGGGTNVGACGGGGGGGGENTAGGESGDGEKGASWPSGVVRDF